MEISILNVYSRKVLRRILKLHDVTAVPAIHLLSGGLPAEAIIHMRQFSLLKMVANLGPSNPLYNIAYHNLTNKVRVSWFLTLRKTASTYGLPDPLHLLIIPPNKAPFKSLIWSTIISYWTQKFTTKASSMPSLKLMRPLSLTISSGPHPFFTTCSSPHQVWVACIQAKMLAGTYRSCYHVRHWQHSTCALSSHL